jgi:5-formyltetrahydrofolate cyclo-ligase
MNMSTSKNSLRQEVLAKRDAISQATRQAYTVDLLVNISSLPEWKKANTVLLYLGIKTEFDPTPLVEAALSMEKTVVLPRILKAENRLEIRQIQSLDQDLVSGVWGLREPDPSSCPEIEPAKLDFVLVPGVAFDLQGNRMGYGAGFYDRLLSDQRLVAPRISAFFSEQLVDQVPHEAHDLPVDIMVMPRQILRARNPN